ncbi:hypothetical protein CJ230_10910 [Oligella urethralis]|uniref:integrase core domain-containing protein n=1 Tax=Oligella urethralis TaxID=90245 RepID=UPI000C9C2095|nr:hypothetical protein CJ230_10910 [Oligella urethralis]
MMIDFIEPGYPCQDAYIERFTRTCREEVLDRHLFSTLAQLRWCAKQWISIYNT